jgi:hypothetical protein
MNPMDDNIKSSERSVTKQPTYIISNESSREISDAPKAITIHNDTGDRTTKMTIVWNLYAFFFQCQIWFYCFLLENVVFR